MAKIINLARERKRRARAQKSAEAATNAAAHGVGSSERERIDRERQAAERTLDGARRDRPADVDDAEPLKPGDRQDDAKDDTTG